MAEVVGVLSAGAGIASFLIQLKTGIETLQRAVKYNRNQVTGDLEHLSEDLETLRNLVKDLQDSQHNPLLGFIVRHCQRTFIDFETHLHKLLHIFRDENHQGTRRKSLRKILSIKLHAEDDINSIRKKVSNITEMLVMIRMLDQIASPRLVQVSTLFDEQTPTCKTSERMGETLDDLVVIRNKTMTKTSENARVNVPCSCRPTTSSVSGRFWWFDYTPLSRLRHTCGSCNKWGYEWKLRIALSQFDIPYAIICRLRLASNNANFELKPALTVQSVVKNTSPGFEALFLCEHLQISVEDSKQRLRDLYRSDSSFKLHVNPEGKSYLHYLFCYGPWFFQDDQFELLNLFVVEFGMNFAAEDPGFLIKCSQWIGEGWHLYLLDAILEHGFTPNAVNPPAIDQWPSPSNPNWKSEKFTPDPFFIEYLKTIVYQEPGFSGVTDFQELILTDTTESKLSLWISTHKECLSRANFLRQSPLHLAVGNVQTVKLLHEHGHNLDVTDNWGTTPLMYAAAMGYEDVAVYLLSEGASPRLEDSRFKRTFVGYAITYGRWNLILRTLKTIKERYSHRFYQETVTLAVIRSIMNGLSEVTLDERRKFVVLLIELCDDVNFEISDRSGCITGNSLMNYVNTFEEAEALLNAGFDRFNYANSDGKLAIHSMDNSQLTSFCIDHGTDINHVDVKGRTLLLHLLSRLGIYSARDATILRQLRCCLIRGADPAPTDRCRCPCSPGGCSTSAIFALDFEGSLFSYSREGEGVDIFWVFEWLSTLHEAHDQEAAKTFLLSLIRRIKFDDLDMTHVCCHRGTGIAVDSPKLMDENDIDDILEEEDEFVHILDHTLHNLAPLSLWSLRRELMEIMKSKYHEHLQRVAEMKRREKPLGSCPEQWCRVDHGRDEFLLTSKAPPILSEYSMSKSLAAYIVYLEVEYVKAEDSISDRPTKDLCYLERMRWVCELFEIFDLSIPEIANQISHKISSAFLEPDQYDQVEIRERFLASLRTTRHDYIGLSG